MYPELEQLVQSPLLVRYRDRISALLAEEHLKRLHFYETVKEGQKAEFINGEVVMPSPVKLAHSAASQRLFILLQAHVQVHDLGFVGFEKLMVALSRNDYEPDVSFWKSETASSFMPWQMRFPAPDFIAEVLSPSTEAVDREIKFADYAAHGVREYWLVDPDAEMIEQYSLDTSEEVYKLVGKVAAGQITSAVVSGFQIPVRAIFDPLENTAVLRVILRQ